MILGGISSRKSGRKIITVSVKPSDECWKRKQQTTKKEKKSQMLLSFSGMPPRIIVVRREVGFLTSRRMTDMDPPVPCFAIVESYGPL